MPTRTTARPPWKRKNPTKKKSTLGPTQKGEAKARARKAGRKYPNLVDNMAVARKANAGTKKKTASKARKGAGAKKP
jgi:hypothetical protein